MAFTDPMPTHAPLLEVVGLRKEYPELVAVDDISFTIPAGVCFGLLGPNGAGKTTTLEMIEGITEPSAGDIHFRGKPRTKAFTRYAGIQFQNTALMDYLRVDEILSLFASFYQRTRPIEELVELCELNSFRDRYATRLSGGQRQRLLLALALLNDPEIIFLDEPTTGLDPQSRRRFWELIRDIKRQGKTLVLTTHYMDEAELLCDQLLILDRGRIIDSGSPESLLHRHFNDLCISLPESAVKNQLDKIDIPCQANGHEIEFFAPSVESTLQQFIALGIPLSGLKIRNRTLDDLFLKLTGHQLRGE
ncbi:ABC transporter ATP-binding protein [Aestuariirhabdus sp. Z084]|uniref:ABC transporter ATP-binding protein n=1 Tax=Aestuariirhabdus haliotis TaxID=2918751 RepID=UPI00201B4650|nr:ABC transporter ATP-binding protein [Aestuariirhabdus haliotis]MCL6415977.1 ABC transporter ATP-binding protein [Aestuariirhabdus haliotis]MCL6419990.1 ABC transporter ATP-binding protein [Aestuariirhabdus haliotis]